MYSLYLSFYLLFITKNNHYSLYLQVVQSLVQRSVCETCRSLSFYLLVFHYTDTYMLVFSLVLVFPLNKKDDYNETNVSFVCFIATQNQCGPI